MKIIAHFSRLNACSSESSTQTTAVSKSSAKTKKTAKPSAKSGEIVFYNYTFTWADLTPAQQNEFRVAYDNTYTKPLQVPESGIVSCGTQFASGLVAEIIIKPNGKLGFVDVTARDLQRSYVEDLSVQRAAGSRIEQDTSKAGFLARFKQKLKENKDNFND